MKQVCFIFQVHQPFRLRNFHFFEIGSHHYYYDEETNARIMRQVAEKSYLPTNEILQRLIKDHGSKIKISYAISGTALDQMEQYAPEALESFKELAATGNVEFLGQTYSTSLSSLRSKSAFKDEVVTHKRRIKSLFGKTPKVFLNTGLIYSDEIGNIISDMGFKGVIVEGLFDFLNDQSHNYVYKSAEEASLKILLRNPSLSDDITLRFSNRNWSEWPLTADKYLGWLKGLPSQEQVVNLVMDYGTFGERHKKETGISNFLEYLLRYLVESKVLKLSTPEEVLRTFSPKGKLNIPDPISWTGMKNDLSAWLGNDMQKEAMDTLFGMEEAVKKTKDKLLHKDWVYLQSADHFLYMNNEGESGSNWYNPYEGPYEAFMKYMNVLSDFQLKLQDKTKTKSIRKNVNHKQL